MISDATGDTLSALARAAVAQFDGSQVTYHRWSLIRSRLQLHRVLEGIQAEPGPVLCSLVDDALRGELDAACAAHGDEAAACAGPADGAAAGASSTRRRNISRGGNMCWMRIISGGSMPCIT